MIVGTRVFSMMLPGCVVSLSAVCNFGYFEMKNQAIRVERPV
jgi:hypothetical protein